jgi:hypothetical protein
MIVSLIICLLLGSLSPAIPAGLGYAAEAVTLNTSPITYTSGSKVTIGGNGPANEDYSFKVVDRTGTLVRIDQQFSANGQFSFSFELPTNTIGELTVIVGFGGEPGQFVTKNITVTSGSPGGGGPGPGPGPASTPTPAPDSNVDQLLTDALDKLKTPGATDSQKGEAIAKAAEQLKNAAGALTGQTNTAQRDSAISKALEVVRQMADAVNGMSSPEEALKSAESIIISAAGWIGATPSGNAQSRASFNQTVSGVASAVVSKAGTLNESSLNLVKDGTTTKAQITADALGQHIQKAVNSADRLSRIMKDNNLSDAAKSIDKSVRINLSSLEADGKYVISLPSEQIPSLRSNQVSVVADTGDVRLNISPDSIPSVDPDQIHTVDIEIQPPQNSRELMDKKEGYSKDIGASVNDIHVQGTMVSGQTPLNDQLDNRVAVSISLRKVNKTGLDLETLAPRYYNEQSGQWEIVRGGQYHPQTDSVDFMVDHFSIYTIMQVNKKFPDVQGRWSERVIEVAFAKGIVSGKSENTFDPGAQVTRAEFASMLVNTLGLQAVQGKSAFADVAEDQWYASAVNTAYAAKLVEGDESGRFHPNDNISREQMAAMIGRALTNFKEVAATNSTEASKTVASYQDRNLISGWALNSVALVIQEGLMSGTSDTQLSPSDNATREQAAKMMLSLFQK